VVILRQTRSLLSEAIRAVPAVRFALGAVGIVAAVSIARAISFSWAVAALGAVVMLLFMSLLLLFSRLTTYGPQFFRTPALVITWASVLLAVSAATLFFTSVFFATPLDLRLSVESDDLSMPSSLFVMRGRQSLRPLRAVGAKINHARWLDTPDPHVSLLEIVVENTASVQASLENVIIQSSRDGGFRCSDNGRPAEWQPLRLEWPVIRANAQSSRGAWTSIADEAVAVQSFFKPASCADYDEHVRLRVPVQVFVSPRTLSRLGFKIHDEDRIESIRAWHSTVEIDGTPITEPALIEVGLK